MYSGITKRWTDFKKVISWLIIYVGPIYSPEDEMIVKK